MIRAAHDAQRALATAYAPADARVGVAALLALDTRLGQIVRTTREPMVGQMRLTWWFEALAALDHRDPPAEPVLADLARHVVAATQVGAEAGQGKALAGMIDGWEVLLGEEPLGEQELSTYARGRGGRLFAAMGAVCGAAVVDPLAAAGEGWALADLAANVGDARLAARASALAAPLLRVATTARWSRRSRGIGALAHISQWDGGAGIGLPARLAWHRATGR